MSVDGTRLLFEGFLQKRKDTLKLMWATYWFRLQNTTLFFYNEKNCDASTLKGYYYIYKVQSVREVPKASKKHFLFEIILANGKSKMLAAKTAALREQWIEHLWEAMRLSTSAGTLMTLLPPMQTTPLTPQQIYPETRIYEEHSYHPESHSSEFSGEDHQSDGDYDHLPCRAIQKISTPTKMDDVYDSPRSYFKKTEYPTYDVPTCHLRKTFCTTVSEEETQ
ncbi:uncharacterized protein LOC101169947 isoform X2 [Oryzias latipes]|uniref:uncharacterized protein LOC101169947 isoform X2 n=1 Tax=Oryzias latipes TaxID=8090 RepID=UPI0009DAA069|nr:uncharacterized protein LOC101169947 isoform X2 [Oryzias latipes]